MAPVFEPFFTQFQPGELGRRFCIWHAPEGTEAPRGLVVHVHAFAEEMNKSRRMCALQARGLADAGYAVLQFDLLGCGDSAGEFADADWTSWVADVVSAVSLARQRLAVPPPPLWLWGHRAGCLLAREAALQLDEPVNYLLWQPAPSGKNVLAQFLRLDAAAALMGKSEGKASAKAQLASGHLAEVAGYEVRPALATGLESTKLTPTPHPARLEWLDLSPVEGPLSPATQSVLDTWAKAGFETHRSALIGPSFWQTTEIEDAPALWPATLAALARRNRSAPAAVPAGSVAA